MVAQEESSEGEESGVAWRGVRACEGGSWAWLGRRSGGGVVRERIWRRGRGQEEW